MSNLFMIIAPNQISATSSQTNKMLTLLSAATLTLVAGLKLTALALVFRWMARY